MKKTFRAFRNWTLALICLPLLWAVAKHTALLLPAVDAGSRTFFVYEASRAEAIRRVSALVPPGTALTTKPWVEDDYPIVYIDGRAAPGA